MPSEFEFLQWIAGRQKRHAGVWVGIGDDLAVLKWSSADLLLVGVDQVLDGVHFDSAVHTPLDIGKKAMNRNLSDCAAMACLPAAALSSVVLPRSTPMAYAQQLYLGLCAAADPYDCPIVGGDTASWDGKLVLTVTIFGKCDGFSPILRSGAKPGDYLHVTGPLGGSILGRHMSFQPRVHLARQIAQSAKAGAMIDLSDGLSRDLGHICQASAVGAIVEASAVPIHDDANRHREDHRTPLERALHDGEDYELLFTAPLPWAGATCIGRMTADREIVLQEGKTRRPLVAAGWEHG